MQLMMLVYVQVCLMLAHVLSFVLNAPFDDPSRRTATSLDIKFYADEDTVGGAVEAYELSYKSVFESAWTVFEDPRINKEQTGQLESQILSIRADSGEGSVIGGTFTLGMVRSSLIPDDFEHLARTPRIPWNANSDQLLAALRHLKGVNVKEVKRCDEFGDATEGHGGTEQWVGGCPFLNDGGYRWVIVFEEHVLGDLVPKLHVFRNELQKGWSGGGDQIMISRVDKGLVNPAACLNGICSVNVTKLQESTPYLFRMRAKKANIGWTEYSKVSSALKTLEFRVPGRPVSPRFQAADSTQIEMSLAKPPLAYRVTAVASQYRKALGKDGSISPWVDGPVVLVGQDGAWGTAFSSGSSEFATLFLRNLEPSTSYEVRVRYENEVGVGPYSTVGVVVMKTTGLVSSLAANISLSVAHAVVGEADSITTDSISVSVVSTSPAADSAISQGGDPESKLFALQYRSAVAAAAGSRMSGGDHGWETQPNSFRLRTKGRTGVVIQEVSVYSEVGSACFGEFFLEMWDEVSTLGNSYTPGISFGASEGEMEAAFASMDRLKRDNAVVRVKRVSNIFGGYTYEIKIIGTGKLPTPQVRRDTFRYLYQPDFIPTEVNITGVNSTNATIISKRPGFFPDPVELPCWTRSKSPVNVRTKSEGISSPSIDEARVTIQSLHPYTPYEIRVVEYPITGGDADSATRSNVVAVTTAPKADILEDFIARTVSSSSLSLEHSAGNASAVARGSFDATGYLAARQEDQDFSTGVGMGGGTGISGGDGLCLFVLYSARSDQPFEIKRFPFLGPLPQRYTVPEVSSNKPNTVSRISIKCWGGGGGGGHASDQRDIPDIALGGGGAFGQVSVIVYPGDIFTIETGGGGQGSTGENGGAGGFGGGGSGGRGRQGGGGGGGGGASVVRLNSEMVLNVAGGGGGGSTDYCCAHGGGAGSAFGANGTRPGAETPWPISGNGNNTQVTPVARRFEYTSALCDQAYSPEWDGGGGSQIWCISKWDVLPSTLPAEHEHIDYGRAPNKNYVVWAEAGSGGTLTGGGAAGISSDFEIRTGGDASVIMGDGRVAVYTQSSPASWGGSVTPISGGWLYGGRGADGSKGAGGGGGGFYGGGGGGSGIDAAGGGGGSSFTAVSLRNGRLLSTGDIPGLPTTVSEPPVPSILHINESGAVFLWTRYWPGVFAGSIPTEYNVELAVGAYSDDFRFYCSFAPKRSTTSTDSNQDSFSVGGLTPSSTYRFRVVPIYSRSANGRGSASGALTFTTLAPAINYWEPVRSRRLSLAATARGISGPVLQQPNIDVGAEIHTERETSNFLPETRYVDARTGLKHDKPSPRRGQTLNFVADKGLVYMFGGRTDGYPCALTYKDTLDYGRVESGRDVYPCTTKQTEVNEIWTWNVKTYQWEFINTTYGTFSGSGIPNDQPEPRELHITAYVGGNLYILGGKSHGTGLKYDTFFGDLWKLNIEHAFPLVLSGSDESLANGLLPVSIPQGQRLFLSMNASASPFANTFDEGTGIGSDKMCVNSIAVKVRVSHHCMKQLRMSLMGPGYETGAANFEPHSSSNEVLLFDQRSNEPAFCTGGEKEFFFVDKVSPGVDKLQTSECCSPENSSYVFIADGPLSEFVGAPLPRVWTLVVQDMVSDEFSGAVIDWELHYEVDTCRQRHSWENLTSRTTGESPPARYLANSISRGDALFVYGGRGVDNLPLRDLYRLDSKTLTWTVLAPIRFYDIAVDTASMAGASFVMSFWGLLRFGGLLRHPTLPSDFQRYVNDVYVMDPVTLKWKKVDVEPSAYGLTSTGRNPGENAKLSPSPRYFASIEYIPSTQVWWPQSTLTYRALYDAHIPSSTVNYAGAGIDSMLVFGGANGASGILTDGSTGGMLGDMWNLRYANWSTPGSREAQLAYINKHCAWRTNGEGMPSDICYNGTDGSECDFRDLMLSVWCNLGGTSVPVE